MISCLDFQEEMHRVGSDDLGDGARLKKRMLEYARAAPNTVH